MCGDVLLMCLDCFFDVFFDMQIFCHKFDVLFDVLGIFLPRANFETLVRCRSGDPVTPGPGTATAGPVADSTGYPHAAGSEASWFSTGHQLPRPAAKSP